jgi:hypothetical protein
MPLMDGWEVSSDRYEMYEKMMSMDNVGDPIISSKCRLNKDNGFVIISNNGFAWRIKITAMRGSPLMSGKSKWVRWHDVDRIDEQKAGVLVLYIKVREKDGSLKLGKLKKWKLILQQNKDEEKDHFRQRQADFFSVTSDIFNQNKGDSDPPTSDSRI